MQVYELPPSLLVDMPCNPEGILFRQKYVMPGTLGRMETEEAASRIISFSFEAEKWVGVTSRQLEEMIRHDKAHCKEFEQQMDLYQGELDRYHKSMHVYSWIFWLTLGLSALFISKSTPPKKPQDNLPFSGVFAFGAGHIARGIEELLHNEYLQLEIFEAEDMSILYPTPKLVNFLLKCQEQ